MSWQDARGAVKDAFERTVQLREERLGVSKTPVQTGDVKVRNGELKASYESDYNPYREPRYYDYPRHDYDYPRYHRSTEGEDIVGGAIVGGVLGAVAGSLFGGKDGAAAGAVIGGTLGAVSGVR